MPATWKSNFSKDSRFHSWRNEFWISASKGESVVGGELAIAGALGAGTTVKVRIPETHPTLSKVRQVIRILIADDHPILRSGLKEILVRELKGATCGEAGNAQHVLSEVHREHWDLVILDVTMSGRSGLDVLRELRRLRPQTARVGFERAS